MLEPDGVAGGACVHDMTVIIKIVGIAAPHGWIECPMTDKFVRAFDPEAFGGRGDIITSADLSKALRFQDAGEAAAFWRRQSRTVPLRDDGEPNRPMTGYTVEILDLNLAEPSR
jgi:hypothetical protein